MKEYFKGDSEEKMLYTSTKISHLKDVEVLNNGYVGAINLKNHL